MSLIKKEPEIYPSITLPSAPASVTRAVSRFAQSVSPIYQPCLFPRVLLLLTFSPRAFLSDHSPLSSPLSCVRGCARPFLHRFKFSLNFLFDVMRAPRKRAREKHYARRAVFISPKCAICSFARTRRLGCLIRNASGRPIPLSLPSFPSAPFPSYTGYASA